jgi:HK97 gp10 family phage protein
MGQKTRVVVEEDRFDEADAAVRKALVQEVHRAGNAARNIARQIIVRDGAIITGDLWRSVGVEFTKRGQAAELYATVPYASFVHDGTSKMPPRPFFDEAVEEVSKGLEARLKTAFEREMR